MLRELSPLLTAIIVAGRSGSAYAAQIGTMKVTEEIDALRTIGIAPLDLLVLPKMHRARDRAAAAHRLRGRHSACRRHGDGARELGVGFGGSRPARATRSSSPSSWSASARRRCSRDHRAGRLLPGLPGQRRRRERGAADDGERGAVDLSGDRADALFSIVFNWLGLCDAGEHRAARASRSSTVRDLRTRFGDAVVHDGVPRRARGRDLRARGRSGCGKSTLLREMILLQRPRLGLDPRVRARRRRASATRRRWRCAAAGA